MNTATERFIQDAVSTEEWMWNREIISHYEANTNTFVTKDGNTWIRPAIEVIMLDPLAWQAVGKVRGWVGGHFDGKKSWLFNMHNLIDALADGITIEAYLKSIE